MPKKFFFALIILGIAGTIYAMPSERNTRLVWSHDGDVDLAGFYVYSAPESENPRIYSDARRFQIPFPSSREALVLDINPGTTKSWCFKVTAYDTSGNESDFSNEACGFFGFVTPNALAVE